MVYWKSLSNAAKILDNLNKKISISCIICTSVIHLKTLLGTRTIQQDKRDGEPIARGKISLARNISFALPAYVYCEEHVYIYTYLTAKRPYVNYRCYQIILRVKHFYTNQECCEVLTGYLSLGCRPAGDWTNVWHWTKRFKILLSNRK